MTERKYRELLKILYKSPNWTDRASAAELLGRLKQPDAVKPLMERLSEDPDIIVRAWIVWALGELETAAEVALPVLEELASRDPDELLQFYLGFARRRIHGDDQFAIFYEEIDEDVLEQFNCDASWWAKEPNHDLALQALWDGLGTRRCPDIAHALGEKRLDARIFLPALIDALWTGPTASGRQEVALAIGRIGAPEGIPGLLRAMNNKEDEIWVRGSIARALADLHANVAIEVIRQALHECIDEKEKPLVRFRFAFALAILEGSQGEGGEHLREMLARGEIEDYEMCEYNKRFPDDPLEETDTQFHARKAAETLRGVEFCLEQGALKNAKERLMEALTHLEGEDNPAGWADYHHWHGTILRNDYKWDHALEATITAKELHAQLGNHPALAVDLHNAGYCLYYLKRYADAIPYFNQSIPLFLALKDLPKASDGCYNLGKCYRELKQDVLAIEAYEESHALEVQTGNRDNQGRALREMARCYQACGYSVRALQFFRRAFLAYEGGKYSCHLKALQLDVKAALASLKRTQLPLKIKVLVDRLERFFTASHEE